MILDSKKLWEATKMNNLEIFDFCFKKLISEINLTADWLSENSDVKALLKAISKESLANLMNNRPIASKQSQLSQTNARLYNKVLNTVNEIRTKLEFKGKELISSDIFVDDYFRIVQFLQSPSLDISTDPTTKKNAKEVYKNIGTITNSQTGDKVQFVNSAFGKISNHIGYDPRLIGQLANLFRTATFLFDEKPDFETPRSDGTLHKKKNNIVSFSNYGAKVSIDGTDYFIRYSVQNIKNKKGTVSERQFHSQQLSSIKISDSTNLTTLAMWGEEGVASDYKLALFLGAVKEKVDTTGLRFNKTVYHGSGAEIDKYNSNY